MKTLSQILFVLHRRRYKLSVANVRWVLSHYSSLLDSRKQDVLDVAKFVLEGTDTANVIADMEPQFDKLDEKKERKKRQKERTKATANHLKLLVSGED
jgi:hypothetical protein